MTDKSLNDSLVENVHFYYNKEGLMVLTQAFLSKRGYCCQSGCLHCPYQYKDKVDPNVPAELKTKTKLENPSFDDDLIPEEFK